MSRRLSSSLTNMQMLSENEEKKVIIIASFKAKKCENTSRQGILGYLYMYPSQ